MSVTEAAAELGYTPDTIRKHALKFKGSRIGHGPWRFPRAEIELARQHPQILSHPRTTLQELHQKVNRVSLISEEGQNCVDEMKAKLNSFERKLKALEARLTKQLLAA